MEEKIGKGRVITMGALSDIDSLLMQLDELTDQEGIHFNQDVFEQKEEIRKNILSGEIKVD